MRFGAFEADQDGDLHRRLAERIAVESELVEPTVDTVLGAVGRASAVFTMRYHGAIAALRRGRPAILVDYSPKMADLSADLAQAMPALPVGPVSYTHLRAHETVLDLVCRLLLEKKNINPIRLHTPLVHTTIRQTTAP